MSEVLAAFVSVEDTNAPLHVVIPIRTEDRDSIRAIATVAQLRAWLQSRPPSDFPYQEILEGLGKARDEASMVVRIERLG